MRTLALFLTLLLSFPAFAADEVVVNDCASLWAALFNGGTRRKVFQVKLTSGKAAELFPETVPLKPRSGWLGTKLFGLHGWFEFLGGRTPVATHPLNSPADFARVFQPGKWHNFVLEGDTITATGTGHSVFQNMMSKHVDLLSSRGVEPHMSGGFFFDGHGTIYVTNASGTFPTGPEALGRLQKLFEAEFPGFKIRAVPHLSPDQFSARLRDPEANRYDGFFKYPDYRQKEGGIFDLEGDLHLIRRWENYFKRMEVSKEKKEYEDRNRDRHASQDPAKNGEKIGSQTPIVVNRLVNALHAAMREYPELDPHFGPAPDWSPSAYEYLQKKLWPLPVPSKLLVAMMPGAVSRFCVTGIEAPLEAWAMKRQDGSIQPHELFKEAYRLARGDVTQAMVACENVLAKDAESPNRDQSPLLKKLAYIRNDSAPVFDNYGQWYHMFGMGVFTIRNPHVFATVVSEVEILGSRATSFRDRQEEWSNRIGVGMGQGLKLLVNSGRAKRDLPPDSRVDYLNLTEFPR